MAVTADARGAPYLSIGDLASGTLTRLTFSKETNIAQPCWSPDGRFIAYSSTRSGAADIYLAPAAGTGSEETLVRTGANSWSDDFSADGRFLLYEKNDPRTKYDLWMLPLVGERKPKPFLVTDAYEAHARISPDGRWVAYASDASGRPEIYVRSFPAGAGPWLISTVGGDQPQALLKP